MSAPVYLRDRSGTPIGPVPLASLEVLFSVRVVDEKTPISPDGAEFQPLNARPDLLARLAAMRERVLAGQNPWPEGLARGPWQGELDLGSTAAFAALFRAAAAGARGVLWLTLPAGDVQVHFHDGKVVRVHTTAFGLDLGAWLLERRLVAAPALEAAVTASSAADAPAGGFIPPITGQTASSAAGGCGDLGAALISTGALAPHLFLEHFVEWSKWVLSRLCGQGEGSAIFSVEDAPAPPIPLGLDRYGAILEAARKRLGRDELDRALSPLGPRAVIPSQVEGVSVDELKLLPKELRVLKSIDGAKSITQLLEAASGEQRASAMFAIYVALGTGFAVLGDDPEEPKERQEADRLEALYAEWKRRVTSTSSA